MIDPFTHDERSDHELLRELWRLVTYEVLPQVKTTNGRVTRLERFQWGVMGGLAVVSAVLVPLFVRMVLE